MTDYDPKDWFRYLISFDKGDTARKLAPALLGMAAYCSAIAWFVIEYVHPGPDSDLKNIAIMHSLLGFVISTLLVFRTNTAYDRWWEGRKAWGSLTNNSRNLALKMAHIIAPDDQASREFFRSMIPNYAFALKNHLRGHYEASDFLLCPGFDPATINPDNHVPNQVAMRLFSKMDELYQSGTFRPEHLLVLNEEFSSFTDICGICERIHSTPIPYSYSSFLKKFVAVYCLTLPLGYVLSLHYWVIPVVMIVFYVLTSLELIAEEIEDPFGTDANDLPTEKMAENIRKAVAALL
ncbi:putative membrane protein [Fibrella aestuarina BUZ 2]|uniref:Putative membrane protein n=1 Tax=Fibrella aestuarina BUZ 2 TaxID=1166018 RepID=I0KGV0_9BACT|nr:bestrophin family protein [Fibrella aestuarina]CCH03353.1 putative membrane protein [Fibrella aestuarina BUZ 2]